MSVDRSRTDPFNNYCIHAVLNDLRRGAFLQCCSGEARQVDFIFHIPTPELLTREGVFVQCTTYDYRVHSEIAQFIQFNQVMVVPNTT